MTTNTNTDSTTIIAIIIIIIVLEVSLEVYRITMAPSALPYERSHTALKTLHRTIHERAAAPVYLALPERPRNLSTERDPYIDDAISMLSTSANYLYNEHRTWVLNTLEVKDGIDTLNRRIGRVEKDVRDVKSQVDEVKSQVDEVKSQVAKFENQVDEHFTKLESQAEQRFINSTGIQLNSLRKLLDETIEPILAPVRVGDEQRYTAAKEFPETVRDFWKLVLNPSALANLARHYSISGWRRWGRHGSDDTDATEYNSLEDAITAHRDKCLLMLACKWGLQYSLLERPDYSRQQKRKAATDDGSSSRRVRAREEEDVSVESIISRDEDGEMFRQDRETRVRPRMPFTPGRTWSEQYPPMPGQRRMSFESAVLGWRNRSDSTDHRRFHDI